MSGYKRFAIAGAGALGKYIIEELLKEKATGKIDKIIILSRSAAGNDDLVAKGAEVVVVDYTSPSSLQGALQGIDVVISTLSHVGLAAQESLGVASKAVGVKLFVPSEFGGDTTTQTEGLFGLKNAQRQRLEQIGLSWAVFITGAFADWLWYQPFIGFDLANGKIEIGGTGNGIISCTSRTDIARYVAYALTSLPASTLHNHVFKMEGDRTTFNRAIAAYEARTGKKLDVTYVPLEELKQRATGNPADIRYFLATRFDAGTTNGPEEEMNVDWPDFHPQTMVEAMLSYKP
ncbi:NAD-binding protein [Calocera viscosa TUFC12733]|uniref:NAD-binding protein n=1 Tax=Calocera viscosa (strain TUFC12733) TaxID=1330018 RepID=A0A167P5M6_CALVF|nr:NAD-binding protein [Calocera viscosa TUFC12733]